MTEESKMSFLEHLEELRVRLIRSVIAVLVGMIACWFFKEEMLAFLLEPLYEAWQNVEGLPEPKPLNFSSMLEPFVAYLKMSAVGGLFVAAPVVLYQLWKFIAPGLYPKERRLAVPFVMVSSLLFVGGSLMAYSVVFPIGFQFFLDFAAGREMTDLEAEVAVTEPADAKATPVEPIVIEEPETVADAGVEDGGVAETDPKAEPAEEAAKEEETATGDSANRAEEEEAASWYEQLLGRFLGPSCGEMSAKTPGPGEVELLFVWHVSRCGEPPPLDKMKRNDEPILLVWKDIPGAESGFANFAAVDAPQKGRQEYSLRVPANPGLKQLAPVLMIKDYLTFAIRLLLAFGLIFELPILISFLSLAGIVNWKQLLKFSRWFLVLSVVLAAMLTPPDVITQLLLATPLMVLYFLSILFAYIFGPKVED